MKKFEQYLLTFCGVTDRNLGRCDVTWTWNILCRMEVQTRSSRSPSFLFKHTGSFCIYKSAKTMNAVKRTFGPQAAAAFRNRVTSTLFAPSATICTAHAMCTGYGKNMQRDQGMTRMHCNMLCLCAIMLSHVQLQSLSWSRYARTIIQVQTCIYSSCHQYACTHIQSSPMAQTYAGRICYCAYVMGDDKSLTQLVVNVFLFRSDTGASVSDF